MDDNCTILNLSNSNDSELSRNMKNHYYKKVAIIGLTSSFLVIIIIFIVSFNYSEKKGDKDSLANFEKFSGLKMIPDKDLICFNSSDESTYKNYTIVLNHFIEPYKKIKLGGDIINCNEKNRSNDETCIIEHSWIYPCKSSRQWGYNNSKPCIILYYSNDSTYDPTAYKELKDLPSNIPSTLKKSLMEEYEDDGYIEQNLVRVYCTHSDPYNYQPKGFYTFFFPNNNNNNNNTKYLPPIVSIRFDLSREIDLNKKYNITCSLWSKTPITSQIKSVSFQLKHGSCN